MTAPSNTPTHRRRMETTLSGAAPDRVPAALWRHFPVDDQAAGSLAAAVINFQRTYDFDLVKVTPESSYPLKDRGLQDEWRGDTEGTRGTTRFVVHHPDDWASLKVLDPSAGRLGMTLDSLRQITAGLGEDTPVIQTIFSPLSQARKLVGANNLLVHLRQWPDAVHAGLQIITESMVRYVEAALDTGIAGVFYAVQHAQYSLLSRAEYLAFGKPYDLQILEPARRLWLNMLHLHGSDVMFDLFLDYPIQVINWHDQETPPNLTEAQKIFPGTVCGGIQRQATLLLGGPAAIQAEAQRAIQATGGKRFILGTGCVAETHVPYGNLMAVRKAVETGVP